MKKLICSIIMMTLVAFSTTLFAQDSNITVKAGIAYPDAPDKIGFDSAIGFNYGVDKYFTLGLETGFGWVKWKQKGTSQTIGGVTLTNVDKTNLYSLPLLATATVRLADMMGNYGVMPFATGGIGYSWTWFDKEEVPNKTFHGFTWQAMGGVAIKLGSDSDLQLIIEAGYRGAAVENSKNFELDMSGFVARAGVSFPLVFTY